MGIAGQDFGDEFGDEEFEDNLGGMGAVDIMDEAEKQFEESNRLQIGAGDATAMMHSFSYVNASFKPPSDASTSDLLSRSAYFLQNTSKLGALDTTMRPEQRPDLGMGRLRSPDSAGPSNREVRDTLLHMTSSLTLISVLQTITT